MFRIHLAWHQQHMVSSSPANLSACHSKCARGLRKAVSKSMCVIPDAACLGPVCPAHIQTCCMTHMVPMQVDGGVKFSLAHDVAGGNSVHLGLAARELNLVLRL